MCIVCVLHEKGSLTNKEALEALREITETEADASNVDWAHIIEKEEEWTHN